MVFYGSLKTENEVTQVFNNIIFIMLYYVTLHSKTRLHYDEIAHRFLEYSVHQKNGKTGG